MKENVVHLIELDNYEGPLDLLLHLVQKHEIDIFDIPVSLICEKYLNQLELMKVYDLDLAGDFLMMASTLAYTKSRMLMPVTLKDDDDDEDDLMSPQELSRMLLEYKRYKDAAEELFMKNLLDRDVFTSKSLLLEDDSDNMVELARVDLFELVKLFYQMLEDSKGKVLTWINIDKISIQERIREIAQQLNNLTTVKFKDIMGNEIRDIVLSFISILEMSKLKLIKITQHFKTKEISITKKYEGKKELLNLISSLDQGDYK